MGTEQSGQGATLLGWPKSIYYETDFRLQVYFYANHKNYNFLACDWFKKVLFSTNSLAKLLSDSLLLDTKYGRHTDPNGGYDQN